MAVVINGDTGITSVNGTAGAPSITGTDTDTGVVYGTNTVSISTGGTERVRVDSSGNVGVGVTPSAWATVVPAIELKNGVHFASLGTSAPIGYLGANTYYNGTNWIYKNSSQYATRYETNSNGAGAHAWFTAPNSGGSGAGTTATFTQAMTLDASGRLLLNTSSASSLNPSRLEVSSTGLVDGDGGGNALLLKKAEFNAGNQTATMFRLQSGTSTQSQLSMGLFTDSGGASGSFFDQVNGSLGLTFRTGGTERARIDSSGNLLVGTTSSGLGEPRASIYAGGLGSRHALSLKGSADAGYDVQLVWHPATSGTRRLVEFGVGTTYTTVGNIASNGSTTSYNTTSDYRLKENIAPMTGALNVIAQLKPCTYNWKVDGSNSQGFIAHELQTVVPDCVTGEKDAVDENGNPVYQGIDTSFLVATLTAAIQEQQAIITQLQADVAALKGQA